MSISDILATLPGDGELFSLRGYVSYDENTGVIIRFNENTYAVVREGDVDDRYVFPLSSLDDPQGGGHRLQLKLKRGAEVELHYKTLTHRFILDLEKERHFVLDEENCRIRYLDEEPFETPENARDACWRFTIVYEWHCCGSGRYVRRGGGLVGCNSEVYDERCCD